MKTPDLFAVPFNLTAERVNETPLPSTIHPRDDATQSNAAGLSAALSDMLTAARSVTFPGSPTGAAARIWAKYLESAEELREHLEEAATRKDAATMLYTIAHNLLRTGFRNQWDTAGFTEALPAIQSALHTFLTA